MITAGRIQTRIDPALQRDAEGILRVQGIKPSQAIVMLYTEIKRRRGLPFLPAEVPNNELAKDLKEAKNGKGVKTYKNKKDFFKSLGKL
jgi:DNA-damage-inducible protein J